MCTLAANIVPVAITRYLSLRKEWSTNVRKTLFFRGNQLKNQMSFRAFHGKLRVSVRVGSETKEKDLDVPKENGLLNVHIDV